MFLHIFTSKTSCPMWCPHPSPSCHLIPLLRIILLFWGEKKHPNHSLSFGMGSGEEHSMGFGKWEVSLQPVAPHQPQHDKELNLGTYQRMSVSWKLSEWSGLVAGPAPSTSKMQLLHSCGVTGSKTIRAEWDFGQTLPSADKDPGIVISSQWQSRPSIWVFWFLIQGCFSMLSINTSHVTLNRHRHQLEVGTLNGSQISLSEWIKQFTCWQPWTKEYHILAGSTGKGRKEEEMEITRWTSNHPMTKYLLEKKSVAPPCLPVLYRLHRDRKITGINHPEPQVPYTCSWVPGHHADPALLLLNPTDMELRRKLNLGQ